MKKIKELTPSKHAHIASLDGIRGLAAMIVFASHAGLEDMFPGGFGVTVFFFLSGYLITTLLRLEWDTTGTINLKHFYLRRVYRIFPPMYIVLFLLLALASSGVIRNEISFGAITSQFAQLTNYYLIFSGIRHLIPYSGTMWSLAVEEHFYLLFPLALLLLLKRYKYPHVASILAAMCAAILFWRCYLVFYFGASSNYTYHATDTRLDSLIFGCIMGIWSNPVIDGEEKISRSYTWGGLLIAGIAALLASFLYRGIAFRETFRYSLQGIALFPIFFCAVRYNYWPVFSWLDSKIMRGLGLISYTFYLIHLPCLRLTDRYLKISVSGRVTIAFCAAIAFSAAMYFLIERPLSTLRRKLHS